MPSITPQARAVVGGSPDAPMSRRVTVNASTGMNIQKSDPAPAASVPASDPKTGQSATHEETTPQAVTLSPQLTALARKQQKLQQEIQAFRTEKQSFEAGKADFVPKTSFAAKFKENPLEALKDVGMDYEQFNAAIIAQLNGADPVQELRSEVNNLKKTQEDNVNKQYDATLKQYRAEADSLVASDPKAFHFINKGKHQDVVVQHIVDTWKDNPDQVLTVAQAAKEVEEVLRENAKAYADALKELDPPAEAPVDPKKTLPPPKPAAAPRTLTQQSEASAPPVRTVGQFQHLSMKERIAQAVARAQRQG